MRHAAGASETDASVELYAGMLNPFSHARYLVCSVQVVLALVSSRGQAFEVFDVRPVKHAFFGMLSISEVETMNEAMPKYCTRENGCMDPHRAIYYNTESDMYMYWRTWNTCRRFQLDGVDCAGEWQPGWVIAPSFDYFEVVGFVVSDEPTPCTLDQKGWHFRNEADPYLPVYGQAASYSGPINRLMGMAGWHGKGIFNVSKPQLSSEWVSRMFRVQCAEPMEPAFPFPFSPRHMEDSAFGDKQTNTAANLDQVYFSAADTSQPLFTEQHHTMDGEVPLKGCL